MIVVKDGSIYVAENFKLPEHGVSIQFTEKDENGNLTRGTSNEELLDILVHRYTFLQKKRSTRENEIIINLLKAIKDYQNIQIENFIRIKKFNAKKKSNGKK